MMRFISWWTVKDNMEDDRDYALFCPHCHKHTAVHIPYAMTRDGQLSEEKCVAGTSTAIWNIGVCNACDNAMIIKIDKRLHRVIGVYPAPLPEPTDPRIPEEIRLDMDEAKLCASVGAFNGAAILYRRALETICVDKGAPDNLALNKKIDWLLENQIVTRDIRDWAHTVRIVGNEIAHPSGKKRPNLDKQDTIDMGELVDKLAYTLYVAVAIAKKQKEKSKGV